MLAQEDPLELTNVLTIERMHQPARERQSR